TSACWPGGRGMSSAGELSDTTSTGVDQAAARGARCDTQTSTAPAPPARSEPNPSVSPSLEMAELGSDASPFTAGTAAGGPNGASGEARVANQTSPLPLIRSVVK